MPPDSYMDFHYKCDEHALYYLTRTYFHVDFNLENRNSKKKERKQELHEDTN